MNEADSLSALDRATPRKYWIWAGLIALVGVVLRQAWYLTFFDNVVFSDLGRAQWAFFEQAVGQPVTSGYSGGELLTPVGGDLLRAVSELTSEAQIIKNWAGFQNGLLAVTTLATFALSRRVLFGWTALLPALLLTVNPLVAELAALPTEYVLLAAFAVCSVLLLCIAHEQKQRGSGDWRIAAALVPAGLLLGLAVLTHLAAWLLFVPVLWWAFRGVDRSWGVVLLLAALLLPAVQLGVLTATDAQKREDAVAIIERGLGSSSGAAPANGSEAAEWVSSLAEPSPLPEGRTWIDDLRPVGWALLALMLLLASVGVWALWLEGAGSGPRLIVLPLLMLLGIFLDSTPLLLRTALLPSLMICATVAVVLVADRISAGRKTSKT